MQGTYDPSLVVLSILIAALASYVAIEFAGRIFARHDQRGRWLTAGAVAMGSGIWAMHFVGMAAFTLPIPVSYDLGITVGSWLAAVAVSGLALHLVSRGPLSAGTVTLGALAMGAGVCIMHYAGMGAMRMDPGLGYDLPWFIASVLIAVGASAAALVIVARLRTVRSWRDVGLRTSPAQLMVLAEGLSAEAVRSGLLPGWRRLARGLEGQGVQLAFGLAEAPADGDNAQALVLRAASRSAEREEEPAPAPRLGALSAFQAGNPAVRDSAA